MRFDYQALPALRFSYKYPGPTTAKQVILGSLPGLERHGGADTGVGTEAVIGQLQPHSTTFLEGTYGRAGNKQRQLSGQRRSPTARTCGAGEPAAALPGRQRHQPGLLRLLGAQHGSPARRTGTATASTRRRTSAGAIGLPAPPQRAAQRRAEQSSRASDAGPLGQFHQGLNRHTFKAGYYNNHSLKREIGQRVRHQLRDDQLRQRHRPIRSTRRSGSPTRRSAASRRSSRRRSTSRAATSSTTASSTCRTTGRSTSKLTLDYGVRFVNAHAAVRQPAAGRQLPARARAIGARAVGLRAWLRQRRLSRARERTARP